MKRYEFNIGQASLNLFFPKFRVKNKIQVLQILLEATRFMLVYDESNVKNIAGKIILVVDKMSRLFFCKADKYFSISFPFFVKKIYDELNFSFQNEIEIDAQVISNIFNVIKCDKFNEKCSLDFIEPICEIEENYDDNFWNFLKELLLYEYGYIRYDKDLENFLKAKKKGAKDKHPVYHFDCCYTSNATFKIGLEKEIQIEDFIDFLNTNTDCRYIK